MSAQPLARLTIAEYLAHERRADQRHEFFDGEIFAMAGASLAHNEIVGNLIAALRPRLAEHGCGVYASDLRVRIEATELFTYPDVVVVCGEPQITDEYGDTVLNPRVLVEVLSPSTESWDRGGKFAHYRTIPSLTDYLLVSQARVLIEHYVRQGGERWLLSTVRALEDVVELPFDVRLTLADVYARVRGLQTRLPRPDAVG